jgi:hypothetical protein
MITTEQNKVTNLGPCFAFADYPASSRVKPTNTEDNRSQVVAGFFVSGTLISTTTTIWIVMGSVTTGMMFCGHVRWMP